MFCHDLCPLEQFRIFDLVKNKFHQIKNYYIFRDTYKGIRNFYIVTNDKKSATENINLIKNSGKQRAFEFEILTDKNWNIYNEFRKKMPNE